MLIPSIAIAAALFAAPPAPSCYARGDARIVWSAAVRADTYRVVRETCELAGAQPFVCDALHAVTLRESRGVSDSIHTRGNNELGFGPHGIGWKYWRGTIADAKPADFCDPRKSTLAVLRMWRFFIRRGAKHLTGLQRGYAGRRPTDGTHPHADGRFCYLLKHQAGGLNCWHPIEAADLGRKLSAADVHTFADRIEWSPPREQI